MRWVFSSHQMLDSMIAEIRQRVSRQLSDGPVTIELSQKKPSRSDQQNRLYRVWCRILSQQSGQTMEVWDEEILQHVRQKIDEDGWHDLLRYAYLPSRSARVDGKDLTILTTTTRLSVQAMNEYMTQVMMLAARMGIQLPVPEDCQPFYEYRQVS